MHNLKLRPHLRLYYYTSTSTICTTSTWFEYTWWSENTIHKHYM